MKSIGIIIVMVFLAAGVAAADTPHSAAKEYLAAWQAGNYSSMYQLLSKQSKDYVSRGEFVDQYRDFATEFIIQDFEITETIHTGLTARVYYRLYLTRIGFGESVSQSDHLDFSRENKSWKIDY